MTSNIMNKHGNLLSGAGPKKRWKSYSEYIF